LLAAAITGAAAAQTGQPFPHRIHLALKLECAGCHPAALTSTRLEDNLLPERKVCFQCHKTAVIHPPPVTRLARFDHQRHLKLGNIAPVIAAAIDHKTYLTPPTAGLRADLNSKDPCVACHRSLEISDKPERSDLPQMADCLVCHSQIDPPDSCQFCHLRDTELKPANHTSDFLDSHTTGKAGLDRTTCAVCHGRHFRCLGCH